MAEHRSADRLRERLAQNRPAAQMYQSETLYHVQVDWTCQLLDIVDEVTDVVTSQLITDTIYERLTGDGVSAAAVRQREAVDAAVQAWGALKMPPRLTSG